MDKQPLNFVIKDAARLLSAPLLFVKRLVHNGKLHSTKLERRRLIPRMNTNSTNLQRKVVKVPEAAQMLGISTMSVRRLIKRNLLHASYGMRHYLIRVEEIERYLRDTEI